MRALLLLLLCLAASPAWAEERHFAIVFACQSEPRQARYSHTFLALITVDTPAGKEIEEGALSITTISWLSADRTVKVWAPWSEPGVNLDLPTSFQTVFGHCEKVYAFGPMEITCDAHRRFLEQRTYLEARRRYKAVDVPFPWVRADNCVHAISHAIPGMHKCNCKLWTYGEPTGRALAEGMREQGMVISEGHDWLFDRLMLEGVARDSSGRVSIGRQRAEPAGMASVAAE
jgi:hypothetical protein